MRFFFSILILFFLVKKADGKETDPSILLPVTVKVGSGHNHFHISPYQKEAIEPKHTVILENKMTRITQVEPDKLFFEFIQPERMVLFQDGSSIPVAEQILRSFYVVSTEDSVQRVMHLKKGDFIILDEIIREKIKEFLDLTSHEGYDRFIKGFADRHSLPPRLMILDSLSLFLPIQSFGERAPVTIERFNVISTPHLLPWQTLNPSIQSNERDLMQIKEIYDAEDPYVQRFVTEMNNLIARMRELMAKGWYDGLLDRNKLNHGSVAVETMSQNDNRVVLFSEINRCSRYFR